MTRLCILSAQSHDKHVIIRRQLGTFVAAGYEVAVVDQGDGPVDGAARPYRHTRLGRADGERAARAAWRIVRRLPSERVHARFWRTVLGMRTKANALRAARAALREKPDVYIAEDLQSAWAATIAARFHPGPVFYCAHELESEQGDRDEARQGFLRSLQRRIIPRVDRLIVPNRSRAEVYRREYRPRIDPTVILNCPPTTAARRSRLLREALGVGDSTRLVLYHGALIPFRALDKLVASAAYFDPDIALVLLGEQGEYFRTVLSPLLQDEKLRGRVFALPSVPPDQVVPYAASADLGVVIYENVNLNNYLCAPTKLYEYLMLRVPFVAVDFPEIAELLREYPVGATFDPTDPRAIARAVNGFFARGAAERAEMQRALGRARERFTWEREGQKWLDLLQAERDGQAERDRRRVGTAVVHGGADH